MASKTPGKRNPWIDTIFVHSYGSSGTRTSVCKYCAKVIKGGSTRMRAHFLWVDGQGAKCCLGIPEEVFLLYDGNKEQYASIRHLIHPPCPLERAFIVAQTQREKLGLPPLPLIEELWNQQQCPSPLAVAKGDLLALPKVEQLGPQEGEQQCLPLSDATSIQRSAIIHESSNTALIASTTRFGNSSTTPTPGQSRKRPRGALIPRPTTLQEDWGPFLKQEADMAEEQMFYQCNLPFNIVQTPAYINFYHKLVAAVSSGCTNLQPPTPEGLRTTRLHREEDHITSCFQGLRDSWNTYGCSIIINGWRDIRQRGVLNILVSCCVGTIFLGAVDCTKPGLKVTTAFIWSHIEAAIKEVGPEHVVQVVTDNTSNCKAMGEILEQVYPHIFWTPCALHCLDLMCEDISKLSWVSCIIERGMQIVKFISKKPKALDMFKAESEWELVKPAKTWYGYIFLVFVRLVRVKESLLRLIYSRAWRDWSDRNTSECYNVEMIIQDNEFWRVAEGMKVALEPLWTIIRLFNMEGCTMALMYEFVERLGNTISHCNGLELDRKREIEEIWRSRWDWFHRPIHIVAHLLHPLYTSKEKWSESVLLSGWTTYMERVYSSDDQMEIENAIVSFRYRRGYFAREIAQRRDAQVLAIDWWEKFGVGTPKLQMIACRVLSQDCTAKATQRIWSICPDIRSKKRNRLSNEEVSRLVFVNVNLRLLERYKTPEEVGPIVWQPRQVNPDNFVMEPKVLSEILQQRPHDDLYDYLQEESKRHKQLTRSQTLNELARYQRRGSKYSKLSTCSSLHYARRHRSIKGGISNGGGLGGDGQSERTPMSIEGVESSFVEPIDCEEDVPIELIEEDEISSGSSCSESD